MSGWPGERKVVCNRGKKQASYSTPVAAAIEFRALKAGPQAANRLAIDAARWSGTSARAGAGAA